MDINELFLEIVCDLIRNLHTDEDITSFYYDSVVVECSDEPLYWAKFKHNNEILLYMSTDQYALPLGNANEPEPQEPQLCFRTWPKSISTLHTFALNDPNCNWSHKVRELINITKIDNLSSQRHKNTVYGVRGGDYGGNDEIWCKACYEYICPESLDCLEKIAAHECHTND